MLSHVLVIVMMCIATGGQTHRHGKSATDSAGQTRLAELIAQGHGPYTKLGEGVWSTPYKGKNMPVITIKITGAEGGVFFFVDLFDRKSITLSRNLLLKMAELNSEFDYAKILLSEDTLQVRLDVRAKLIDEQEFRAMEQQVASVADEAYGLLKDFVQ